MRTMRKERDPRVTTKRDYSQKIEFWRKRLAQECAVQPNEYDPIAAKWALNSLEYFINRQAELDAKKAFQKVG